MTRKADYLIIGAGAVGLAFADTILAESDASIVIVDRHGRPGGHWNDAYDFVRLHQPSAFYGVNSLPLGSAHKDQTGLNAGLFELASGSEVSAYFDRVMHQQFLPSGRVQYFPMSDYRGEGRFVSLLSGDETQVEVARKTVDATYYGTSVPSTHTPKFEIAGGVQVVPPNGLSRLWQTAADAAGQPERYVILGAGKTAMDVGVFLLQSGVPGERISWVMPRDSWLLNRKHTQPTLEFFHETMGAQTDQVEALAAATDLDDLFARLEASGLMLRIFPDVKPTMYHCATISEGEVALLRQIKDVIRMGHVRAVTPGGLDLAQGRRLMPERSLYIDCTASAVEKRPAIPVFQGDRITLQMIRTCQPAFSSALAAHVELAVEDEARKNQLTGVVPLPDGLAEFLPVTLTNMMNQFQWSQDKDIRQWMLDSRLDGFAKVIAQVAKEDADKQAVLTRFRAAVGPAIANIHKLMSA